MKRAFLRDHGKAGLEVIEEAAVLLRACPPSILATYYLGSVPFAAGFLLLCSDLSRHAEAFDRLGSSTLVLTALFIWMKIFHARFGAMLLARLRGEAPAAWAPGSILRSAGLQTVVQSTALFILPIAMVAAVPFAWVYAFYQNVSALDDGRTPQRALVRSAAQQSLLWPGQNHVLLLALSGFGFFVFLNWVTVGFFLPQGMKMLFGLESAFTRSPLSLFNTTFFAATAVLTYLSVDPLLKACYVLRCFSGRSLRSGDDLKTEIRRRSGRAAALAACLFLGLGVAALPAAESPPPPLVVTGPALDQSIRTVAQQPKYTWKSPREKPPATGGLLQDFLESFFHLVGKPFDALANFLGRLAKWLHLRDRDPSSSASRFGWELPHHALLYGVLALVAGGLALAALRVVRLRRRPSPALGASGIVVPDMEDENTTADELPEDDWTRLGRRFLEQGELRLALRSFYLASLAHLAAGGLITIGRSKSNRDYERDLRRRGHGRSELPALFGENVGIFDRVWYGRHEASPELVQRFLGNLERIKDAA